MFFDTITSLEFYEHIWRPLYFKCCVGFLCCTSSFIALSFSITWIFLPSLYIKALFISHASCLNLQECFLINLSFCFTFERDVELCLHLPSSCVLPVANPSPLSRPSFVFPLAQRRQQNCDFVSHFPERLFPAVNTSSIFANPHHPWPKRTGALTLRLEIQLMTVLREKGWKWLRTKWDWSCLSSHIRTFS